MSSAIPEGKLKLGKALLSGGLITREILEAELEKTQRSNSRMAKALLNCNFPSESDLIQVIARNIRVPNVRLQNLKASPEVVAEIPKSLAKEHKVLALEKIGGLLVIVTPDLGNHVAFDAVRKETGCFVAPIRCPEEGFLDTVETFYKDVKKTAAPAAVESAPETVTKTPAPKTPTPTAPESKEPSSTAPASGGASDPDALLAIPASPADVNGNQASTKGYYDVMSIWEHRYSGDGPVLAESLENN
ncbi:MAG: hypothetical protein P1V97_17405 [Planctomycetota bacterium]|nr:hypothetical protein [Planctomycetota bacterium]